jgi:hypothetical protein
VFHRPREQELVELLQLQSRGGRHPRYCATSLRCSVRVFAPGRRTAAHGVNTQLIGQPSHRHRRCGGHLVRHESARNFLTTTSTPSTVGRERPLRGRGGVLGPGGRDSRRTRSGHPGATGSKPGRRD